MATATKKKTTTTKKTTTKKAPPPRKKKAPAKKKAIGTKPEVDPPEKEENDRPVPDKPEPEAPEKIEAKVVGVDAATMVNAFADGIGRGIAEAVKGSGCFMKIRVTDNEATIEVVPLGTSLTGETAAQSVRRAGTAAKKAAKEMRRLTALSELPYKVGELKDKKRRELLVIGAAIGVKHVIKLGATENVVSAVQAMQKELGPAKLKEMANEATEAMTALQTDAQ